MAPRRRTIVLGTAAVLLLMLVAAVGGVVGLTQTDMGRSLILRTVLPIARAAIPGKLYVAGLRGTLFTDLAIDTLDLRTADGRPFITTGPIRLSYDPRDLFDARIVIKSLEVTRPQITLIDYGDDDWNWKRALRRGPSKAKGQPGRFGRYIVIDTTTLHEATFVARLPWELSDTLRGAKRDSALKYNLTRLDGERRAEDNRVVQVYRFVRGNVALGRTRIADPDSAGQFFTVRKLDVVWMYPPLWFQGLEGGFHKLGDSLFVKDARFSLPGSRAHGNAKVVWGGDLPVRYDIRLQLDTVSMSDLAWIDATVPHVGGGRAHLVMKNDPRNLGIIDYQITNMDARSHKSRLRGNMTWGVGGFVTRLTNVDLELEPAHTDLLKWFNGEPFPYDWRGDLRGRVTGRGGFLTSWQLDDAQLSFADEHVPGAVSRARAKGMLDIYAPADAILKGVELTIEQLDFRTPRFVNPLFAELNGIARGRVRLDSLWYDARFADADIELVDGPGQPSRFTGSGRYKLVTEGTWFDVDLQAVPLSYTTLSRSYPDMPLRGSAVGRIVAKGMADQFDLQATLAGEGGELSFTGAADALVPVMGASGAWRGRGVNLQSLFGDSRYPTSSLTMAGQLNLRATVDSVSDEFVIGTIRGPLTATVDQFSRIADARLFGGTMSVQFDSGHVRVDTLQVESSALRMVARGGLGLDRTRRDSLKFSLIVDSLGGIRPWLSNTSSGRTPFVLPTDTLRGTIEMAGTLFGSVDSLDTRGLDLDARADLRDLVLASSRSLRAGFDLQVRDVLRGANGTLIASADSAFVMGVDVSAATARSTLRGGLAERFSVAMRTPTESRVTLGGGVTRSGDTTDVRFDTVSVRVDSGGAKARGFALATPATLRFFGRGRGALDSLVLQHTDTGRVLMRGAIGDSGVVRGQFAADRVPLGDLGRLLRSSGLTRGAMTADFSVVGTREAPRMDGTVRLTDAVAGRVRFGELFARAHYDSLRVALDGSLRVGGQSALAITASLPMDLALSSRARRTIDEPLTGRIVSQRADLGLLEALFPDVTKATGTLETDVALTGTWDRPRLRGQMRVDSASLSLENLGIRLEKATADIGLLGDTIHIRRFGAVSGAPTDSLGLSGYIGITEIAKPSFNLHLAANNFLAVDKARAASLTLTTTRPITLEGTSDAPVLRGAVRLDRGRIYINQLAQRRALDVAEDLDLIDTTRFGVNALLPNAPSMVMRNLQLDDVRLRIGDDVWLRSPEANLKLGGQLRLTRSVGRDARAARLALADSLTVERGTYQLNLGLARPSFEVERGLVRFFGDPDLEPSLDIAALHTVRETRANSNRQDVRIRVNIGGTIERPTLALTSADNPPLPESDMLSYLVTGEPAYSVLGSTYAEQGATLALRLAGSYLSSRLAGGRFDVVQVEPTSLNSLDAANLRQNGLGILASTRVGVGGQIARNTYLTFSTGLCGLAPQTGSGDALSLFAEGLGVKVERRFEGGLSVQAGLEPGSSAQACGRLGISRTFQQTPPQIGIDFFRFWTF
ncbi:MAG: translocation/assembly module TamB domain-containing protein [Gemmatimonadaceae bacterium]|nr:translocation/assembly module TamB domain-containing protein [Gemmatimonadaceae bacterium]